MNLDIKIVLVKDKKQLMEFTQRFYTNIVFGFIYFEKVKYNINKII